MVLTWSAKCPKCGTPNQGGPLRCENCDSLDVNLDSWHDVRVACNACATCAPVQLACKECGTRLEKLVARNALEAAREAHWSKLRSEERKELWGTLLVLLGIPFGLFVLAMLFVG